MEKVTPEKQTATPITNEVSVLFEGIYLIRINGEIVGFVDDEKKGTDIISSLASAELKKITRPSLKILKQEFKDGKEIQICTQSLGSLWNGKLKKIFVADMVPAPKIKYKNPTA